MSFLIQCGAILLEQKYFPELESFNIPNSINSDKDKDIYIKYPDPHHLIFEGDYNPFEGNKYRIFSI